MSQPADENLEPKDISVSLRTAGKALQELSTELLKELARILGADPLNPHRVFFAEAYIQVDRRIFVRSVFSYIEAITFATKSLVLSDPSSAKLSDGERILAAELAYELKSNGNISARPAKISLAANIIFTFKIFNKIFGSWTELDVSGQDWECFRRTIAVRDRIAHPKKPSDLFMIDSEVIEADRSLKWFNAVHSRAMIEFYAIQSSMSRKLDKVIRDLMKTEAWSKIAPDLRSRTLDLLERKPEIPEEFHQMAMKLLEAHSGPED